MMRSTSRPPWLASVLVALAAWGCLVRPPATPAPASEPARPRPVPTSTAPTLDQPTLNQPSLPAPTAASGAGRLELALVNSGLRMDGEYVAPIARIDYVALFARLRQRRAAARASEVIDLELKVDETADSRVTGNILSLTDDAGYERVELITAVGRLSLCTEECRGSAQTEKSPALRTVVLLRRDGIAVWSGREVAPDPSGAAHPEIEPLLDASWSASGDHALEAGLQRVCSERTRCSRVFVYFDAELPRRGLVRVLEALDRAARAAGGPPPTLRIGLWAPPAAGEEAIAFVRVRDDAGRLPAVVVRQVVRASYGAFRECYARGLSANPKLTGQVMVRFVIQSDGTVSSVSRSGGDLPREVTNCVLHGFTRLRFPTPKDGLVTVQYPILMLPG